MRSGSCPQRHMPPLEPSLSARRAIFTSLPVVVALFLLPAIAFASPPGQLWIAGIYDGADGDDIVTLGWALSIPGVSRKTSKGIPRCDEAAAVFILSGAEDLIAVEKTAAVFSAFGDRIEDAVQEEVL